MIDIEKIKQAALAATEGRWSSFESLVYLPEQSGGFDICDAPNAIPNATFIATANPSAVLELITRLEAAEQDATRYQWLLDKCSYFYSMQPDSPSECGIDFQWQQATYEERNFGVSRAIDANIEAMKEMK